MLLEGVLMLEAIARNWWVFVLRGVLAILFGIGAFIWPAITLGALILLYGIFALADGILALIGLISGRRYAVWWAQLLQGLLGIAAGLIALAWPGLTALALLWVIAFWAILTGVMQIAAAVRLRNEITNEWYLILGGVLSVALGIAFLFVPGAGILSLVWLLGTYAILFGVLGIGFGLRLRRSRSSTDTSLPHSI
jgi:uncharacterized membrane protein HdeD (DUF308 family)